MTTVAVMIPQEELQCKSSAEDSLSSSVLEFISESVPADSNFSEEEIVQEKVPEEPSNSESINSNPNAPDSSTSSIHPKRKNKHRRKKKWKPYSEMTWAERKRIEERDARRANRIRDQMAASGFPCAPFNTTQFLMEDHNVQEPDYEQISNGHRKRTTSYNSTNNSSSDDFYSSPEDEKEFLEQQFVQDYEDIHAERLNNMTKCELVEELISVEDKVEELEKFLEQARALNRERTLCPNLREEELEKIRVFKEEIEKLKRENLDLEAENDRLRQRLKTKT